MPSCSRGKITDYSSPVSEVSEFPWASLTPSVAREKGRTRNSWTPGSSGPAREAAPSTRSSHPEGTQASGGAIPTDRDPSSRRGGGYDAPRNPIVSAARPRGERARCTGVARAPGTVNTSARPLPSRAPSLRSGHPAYLRVQLGHRHGRERTARGLRRCKAWGLGRRLCGPGAGNRRCGSRKSALGHLAEEVSQKPTNFAERWRPGRREVADWSFPARGEASL